MADSQHGHGDHSDAHGSHGPGRYIASFAVLFVCTVLTYGLHHVDLGTPRTALLIAMAIASVKAAVVILFFMHLWDHPGVNRLVLGVSILFLGIAIAMVIADNVTRFPLAAPHF